MKFIDFCAGIGGGRLGLEKAGFECIGFSEIDKKAIEQYRLMHKTNETNYGDLTKIIPCDLPDFDIMIGGFPCQTFSIAGSRKGFDDPRGRIVFYLADILKVKQPKYFLLENVKGILEYNNGGALQKILSTLRNSGYNVNVTRINSVSSGLPQLRDRVYFIGSRVDVTLNKTEYPMRFEVYDWKTFLNDNREEYIIKDESIFDKYLNTKYNKINKTIPEYDCIIDMRQTDMRIYDTYIPCLRASRNSIYYKINGVLRKLSGKEALKLQGFDDERIDRLTCGDADMLKLAGNGMTVNVIEELGKVFKC